jgi:hypothetical protein
MSEVDMSVVTPGNSYPASIVHACHLHYQWHGFLVIEGDQHGFSIVSAGVQHIHPTMQPVDI